MTVRAPTLFDGMLIALLRPIGLFGPPEARAQAVADIRDSATDLDRQRDEDRAARAAGPNAVAHLEQRILAEEATRRAESRAAGFDEGGLEALDLARCIDRVMPGLVRMPNGRPN